MERTRKKPLSAQIKEKHEKEKESPSVNPNEYDGDSKHVISTGSTLLDLAISGGRFQEGGIPSGILVEIFGPPSAGKTVLLCQIAAGIQKRGGQIMFHDPEARLDKQFAKLFGVEIDDIDYTTPDTIPQVFESVRKWHPEKDNTIHAVLADSLAALSTDMEMGDKGDKMGMRRAKEFSEELRKTCRIIKQQNLLMICSNQIRQNLDAGPWGQKYKSPGGESIGFYSSLRLRCKNPKKINKKRTIAGTEHKRVVGTETEIEVFKSSVWEPFHSAPVSIIFDYGIDQIRDNLKFIKDNTKNTTYMIGDQKLDKSIFQSIRIIEEDALEQELKKEVIELWNEIEDKFKEERKPKQW